MNVPSELAPGWQECKLKMYVVIWEYRVRRGKESEFEEVYAPDGAWAELFKQAAGYLGTSFLRDSKDPRRFLTIDRWVSQEAYEDFLQRREAEYRALDADCEALTEDESALGKWVYTFQEDR